MRFTITYYDCSAYLRRRGFLIDGDPLPIARRGIPLAEIQAAVAAYYDLPVRIMTDGSRFRAHARPRQVAVYLARQLTVRTLPELGRHFGGRDHTTMMHAIAQIEKLRAVDEDLNRDIENLNAQLSTPCVWRRG